MEYICEDNQVAFNTFEKQVGTQGTKAAEAATESGSSQSIVGEWKGTIHLADARSLSAAATFSVASTVTITVTDPSVSMKYEFQKLSVSAGGTITGITADGIDFLGKLSQDGKEITGDIILPSGTGHKISVSRP
jgi:hypothetical protein